MVYLTGAASRVAVGSLITPVNMFTFLTALLTLLVSFLAAVFLTAFLATTVVLLSSLPKGAKSFFKAVIIFFDATLLLLRVLFTLFKVLGPLFKARRISELRVA